MVNGKEVGHAGFESEEDVVGPDLETSSLIWSGNIGKKNELNILVLTNTNAISSNVNPAIGSFGEAKGAFLSVIVDNCSNSLTTFKDQPTIKSWNDTNGEVILYDEIVKIKNNINVNASIASFLSGANRYNIYRLYINEKQIGQGGYESDTFAPNLETSMLIWGSTLKDLYDCHNCNNPKIRVKVTAQLIGSGSSNVDNETGSFQGSKGAFLSVFSYD